MTKEQTNGWENELKEIIDGDWELMELNPGKPYREGMKEVHFIKLKVLISQEKEKWILETIRQIEKDFKSRTEKDEKPDYTIGRERTLADVLARLRDNLLQK